MAIAYDSNGAALGSSTSSSFTFSFTVGSGVNRILFVSVYNAASGVEQVSAITYNGVSMTKIGYAATNAGTSLWYLLNPATGPNNLVFTSIGGSTVYAAASSYSGVKQSGQPDASVIDSTHAASAGGDVAFTTNVTTVADNCWIIASTSPIAATTGSFSDCTVVAAQNSTQDNLYHKGPVTPAGSNSITIDSNFMGGTVGCTVLASFSPATSGTLLTRRARQNAAEVGVPLPVSILPSGSINNIARAQIGWSWHYAGPPASGTRQFLPLLGMGS